MTPFELQKTLWVHLPYPLTSIGKTVFLTREEAETRLKELEK